MKQLILISSAIIILCAASGQASCGSLSSSPRRSTNCPIRFASFNIQVFGRKKAADQKVMSTLTRILARYDLVVAMEIRDSSGEVIVELVKQTNRLLIGDPFAYVISERTGRTASKEQYAILYRSSIAEVLSHWTVSDPGDRFQREPFAARLSLKRRRGGGSVRRNLTLVCLHTEPETSVAELDALHDIVRPMRRDRLLIAGDLNADCSYVNRGEMTKLALRHDADFKWLIGDDVDTTVKSTDCAYDRLIVSQPAMDIVANARVFKFDSEYGLSTADAAKVSDHYPVELDITV